MSDDLDKLKQALERATPTPDPAARMAAIAAARKKFEETRQGSEADARPINDRPSEAGFLKGLLTMFEKLTTRQTLTATTAFATLALAVGLTWQMNESAIDLFVDQRVPLSVDPNVRQMTQELGGEGDPAYPDANKSLNRLAPATMPDELTESVPVDGAQHAESNRSEHTVFAAQLPPINESSVAQPGSQNSKAATAGQLQVLRRAPAEDQLAFAPPRPVVVEEEVFIPERLDNERFANAPQNPLKSVKADPVSTFSIDVDTASYSLMRSSLMAGQRPHPDAIRVEELINYFDYAYPAPDSLETPFRPSVSVIETPWNPDTKLVQIGIKGYEAPVEDRPPLDLVFLIDTSGSMQSPNKLPLLKASFRLLLSTLKDTDKVAIVTYAGSAGTVLEPTEVSEKSKILDSLDRLSAGGSTAGAAGLQGAYRVAEDMADEGRIGRVILATDGDFNVGISDPESLKEFISDKRDSGTYLSVLGFGRGNINDALMQALAQNGNGQASYIDTLAEAERVLVSQAGGALIPIANDVKIQVEFNPAAVAEYRLIGYETRALRREDFNNDKIDAGEIGSGHTVTAIYEVTPVGSPAVRLDDLRYQTADAVESVAVKSDELAFLRLRYKRPGEARSNLIETPIMETTDDLPASEARFAAAVAGFGELLRSGNYQGDWGFDDVLSLSAGATGDDSFGDRAEFRRLVRLAAGLGKN